jgi:protein-L-isoaspartate(D-aspartate) O-methyltransferase
VVGDGTFGYPERAPYDAVVVTAAGPHAPQPLIDHLAEGGRLVMPVGGRSEQMLVKIERHGRDLLTTDLCPCRFVPLIGVHGFPD